MIQNYVLFEHAHYVNSCFSVNWCKSIESTAFQEKGEYKLLEFIEETNETAEKVIEESASLKEQLNLALCQYKGKEATNQGPLQ